jgi:hypothetical protein
MPNKRIILELMICYISVVKVNVKISDLKIFQIKNNKIM